MLFDGAHDRSPACATYRGALLSNDSAHEYDETRFRNAAERRAGHDFLFNHDDRGFDFYLNRKNCCQT